MPCLKKEFRIDDATRLKKEVRIDATFEKRGQN
jgi:hypothetical protein